MAVCKIPPPPSAPSAAHEAYSAEVRRELELERSEAHMRSVDTAMRSTRRTELVAADEHLRELEDLTARTAIATETSWPEVRAAARELLARRAG